MKTDELNSKEYIKILSLIHTALFMGQLILGGVFIFLNLSGQLAIEGADLLEVFQLVVPIVMLGVIYGGEWVRKMRLKTCKEKKELNEKLDEYRTAIIIKYALLEASSLLALIAYLMTSNYLFLSLAGIGLIVFFNNRPSLQKIIDELELNDSEKSLLTN
jgi:hypothetical protein